MLTPNDVKLDTVCAAVSQTAAGYFISIWSHKKSVWVRLLNRYGSSTAAITAIQDYGWQLWDSTTPPHSHRPSAREGTHGAR